MVKDKKDTGSGCFSKGGGSCCNIESVVTVDERGQMVLPKDLRDRANIKPGDKLAIISWEKDGCVCCFTMMKANEFGGMIKDMLDPIMGNVNK